VAPGGLPGIEYPFHDRSHELRLYLYGVRKINLSHACLVAFMHDELGFFDHRAALSRQERFEVSTSLFVGRPGYTTQMNRLCKYLIP
jgi:hypothetical protein